ERAHGRKIPQVGLEEGHLRPEVIDVLRLAAPPVRAEDLGGLGQGVLGHVAPHEAGDAGDQDSHAGRAPPRRFALSRGCDDYTLRLRAPPAAKRSTVTRYRSAVSAAMREADKRSSTRRRPACPIAARTPGSASRSLMACPSAR